MRRPRFDIEHQCSNFRFDWQWIPKVDVTSMRIHNPFSVDIALRWGYSFVILKVWRPS